MTTYITFQDNADEICDGTTCDPNECRLYHPADDILRPRFAFWTKANRTDTYETFGWMQNLIETVVEYDDSEHYQPGEATVKDLKTKVKLDVTEFLAQRATVAA